MRYQYEDDVEAIAQELHDFYRERPAGKDTDWINFYLENDRLAYELAFHADRQHAVYSSRVSSLKISRSVEEVINELEVIRAEINRRTV